MIRQLLIASGLVLTLHGNAQYDSAYSSTYYRQKVSQFRLIPNKEEGEIIFLGDSITDIAEWAEILQNGKVKNRGISSDNTYGIWHRLDEVTLRKPAAIFLMIGINDIANNVPDSIILRNYTAIVKRIQSASPGTALYIQSLLPTNNTFTEFPRHQNKTAHILAVNTGLQQIAKETHNTYINLYPLFTDSEGRLDSRYTNDGLHLTGEGYLVWKNTLLTQHYCCP